MSSKAGIYYTVYQTINLINGKIYIGKHQTQKVDDGYLGSGKILKAAIKKYGIENFIKEILYVFDNETDMNAKERELVTEEFVLQETNYNLCVGGKGGFSYINSNNLSVNNFNNIDISKKAADSANKTKRLKFEHDKKWSQNYRRRLSIAKQKYDLDHPGTFKGKQHSELSKKKMSERKKGTKTGENNSQFGTKWITNEVDNRKINATDVIPYGWRQGRVLKNTPK